MVAIRVSHLRHPLDRIAVIHTLGPKHTNCEQAATEWFNRRHRYGRVELHSTLEEAVSTIRGRSDAALLGCVVYPDLHKIVFKNLDWLTLADVFIMPTFHMVLAARAEAEAINSAASHPAPSGLIPDHVPTRCLVNSNAEAALVCAAGQVDACITTLPAAVQNSLTVVRDFGPVPMGFTIHVPVVSE